MAILRPDTSTRKNLEILIILRFPQGQREKDLYWSLIGKEGHRSLINCHRRFFTLLFMKYYSISLLLGHFVGCLIRSKFHECSWKTGKFERNLFKNNIFEKLVFEIIFKISNNKYSNNYSKYIIILVSNIVSNINICILLFLPKSKP